MGFGFATLCQVLITRRKKNEAYRSVFGFPVQAYYQRVGFDFQKEAFEMYFDEILGISNILATSKMDIGKAYIAQAKPQKAVLIGDTLHDKEVADALGVDCILIANGHQQKEALMLSGAVVKNNLWEVQEVLIS